MSTLCPNCQQPVPGDSNPCPHCEGEANFLADSDVSRDDPLDQVVLKTDLHIDEALRSVEEEDFQAALRSLNRAVLDAPEDRLAECYSLRGYVYLKLEDYQRAEADCNEAISRYWPEAQTYAWRAAAHGEQDNWPRAFDDLATACDMAGDKRDQYLQLMDAYIETASEYYRQQIVSGKESADLFFDRGWVYFRAGRKAKAERDFQHALSFQPEHPQASLGMAGLKLESGQAAEALRLIEVVIDRADEETLIDALVIRTRANQKLGNARQVTSDLNQLKVLAAADVHRLLEIGKLRLSLGENARTVSDMTALIKRAPEMREALLIRGEAYLAIQDFMLAINDYSKYLRYVPDSLAARLQRGEAYLKTNQLERAIADFDRSLEIEPVCGQAYLGRSQVFVAMNRLDEALTECQKASRLDNQQAEVFGTLAEIYYQLCDYSRAVEEFVRAERLSDTKSRKAHFSYRRGNAYYQLNQLENSLKYFRKASRLDPNHAGAWIWKAQVCAKLEKWSKAILSLEQAIRSRPVATDTYQELGKPVAEKAIRHYARMEQRGSESDELYRSRGLAHQFLGNHPQAFEDFSQSLELTEDPDVRLRRAQCSIEMENLDQGLADLKRVLETDADNPAARYWRAIAYSKSGDPDRAISDIIKGIKQQANDPRYFRLHAELVGSKQEWTKAIRSLEQAIRLDPLDPVLFQQRGLALLETGNYGRAVSDFTRSLELSPGQTELLVGRGRAYAAEQNFDLAMADFEAALGQNHHCLEAYGERGAALAANGKGELALIWLTKALHRFSEPRQLAYLLFQRGKVFYRMGRAARAINDYCQALDRARDDRSMVCDIRLARSAALAQEEKWDEAIGDLRRVLKRHPDHQDAQQAIEWISQSDKSGNRPPLLSLPGELIRPLRPPQARQPIEVSANPELDAAPPFDMWLVRAADRKEYGPASLETLSRWVSEGRLGVNSQVLRSDWNQWKRVEKLFPELATEDFVESFPEIQTQTADPSQDDAQADVADVADV
ncbi:MAG: tetratricopeptide repeat protein [Mariniblastus sp.]|nr:tetratricopeptide repeat protein [Mariniblastus sp.]